MFDEKTFLDNQKIYDPANKKIINATIELIETAENGTLRLYRATPLAAEYREQGCEAAVVVFFDKISITTDWQTPRLQDIVDVLSQDLEDITTEMAGVCKNG